MFKDKFNTLTKQEKAVCKRLLQLKTKNEIADELFIELSTVITHSTNIYSKLGIFGKTVTHNL